MENLILSHKVSSQHIRNKEIIFIAPDTDGDIEVETNGETVYYLHPGEAVELFNWLTKVLSLNKVTDGH